MDIFNKKKLAALQDKLTLATAELDATTKQLGDLQKRVVESYDDLTEYFKPKYEKKYFCYEEDGNMIKFRCDVVSYNGGLLFLSTVEHVDDITVKVKGMYTFKISDLKNLKIITKKQFLEEESK